MEDPQATGVGKLGSDNLKGRFPTDGVQRPETFRRFAAGGVGRPPRIEAEIPPTGTRQ
jgi:hypothetical protein